MRLAIISDTHLPRGARRLPDACVQRLRAADLILHAGDLMRVEVLEALEALGPPVHAVHGNVDDTAVRARLPETPALDLDGVRVVLVPDAGSGAGRPRRVRRGVPAPGAGGFGHPPIPLPPQEDGL